MTIKERYSKFIEHFSQAMPDADTELNYGNAFELLIAVMLSAQCTDKRVNMTTPSLFARFPDARTMANATKEEVYELIKSISYPNSKAEHIVATARILSEKFGGEVPDDFDELMSLPGVGRKTVNVMFSVFFGKSAMAVDTHVFRLSHRIGLVDKSCTTPLAVEKELTKHFPTHVIPRAHHWLILHGRYVCKAQRPLCDKCEITSICSHWQKTHKQR